MEKSVAAATSAIEIYNKPDFAYRDEAFSILMINAWELLLKARVLQLNDNEFNSICVPEHKKNKDGSRSRKMRLKRSGSGNPLTIGLTKCMHLLSEGENPLPQPCATNIAILQEIRDNSVHYHHKHHIGLSAKLREVGTASLKNYVTLSHIWFECDLSKYNIFLMPMSFHDDVEIAHSFSLHPPNARLRKLLTYLADAQERHPSNEEQDFNVTLRVETRFVKATSPEALNVRYSSDPDAPQISITEEEALKGYQLDYNDMVAKLRTRYSDFKQNKEFHRIREELEQNPRLCRVRFLDPENPKGTKKKFYKTEILKEFDKHYTRPLGR